jgi:antibiotic biosynthesis monooxygenase (ABM) superfamily enzyme
MRVSEMVEEISSDKSVTVVVTRTPKPGREPDYEEWIRGVAKVSTRFPGHLHRIEAKNNRG